MSGAGVMSIEELLLSLLQPATKATVTANVTARLRASICLNLRSQ
jgi:hypothetical protein